jgi:hypothetical protein
MNVDGTFEFYEFIWNGAEQGWGVYSYPPMKGAEVLFAQRKPSAIELKVIRESWSRFKDKPVTEINEILGKGGFIFGKWSEAEASDVCKYIQSKGVTCRVVDVPNYSIVNMKTREAAQIRSEEIYDRVVEALIKNGGEVIPHSGLYPSGGIAVDDLGYE